MNRHLINATPVEIPLKGGVLRASATALASSLSDIAWCVTTPAGRSLGFFSNSTEFAKKRGQEWLNQEVNQ